MITSKHCSNAGYRWQSRRMIWKQTLNISELHKLENATKRWTLLISTF